MSDVAQKIKASEPIKFAGIVCGALPTGRYSSLNDKADDSKAMTPSGLFLKLGDRLDDRTYYS